MISYSYIIDMPGHPLNFIFIDPAGKALVLCGFVKCKKLLRFFLYLPVKIQFIIVIFN